MNFQKSPCTRYLVLGRATDHWLQPYPLRPFSSAVFNTPFHLPVFDVNATQVNLSDAPQVGWSMGRSINLFLETPNWELSTYKVTVRAWTAGFINSGGLFLAPNPRPILIAPNAVIKDPEDGANTGMGPYYTFLRGNPVYPNGALWNSSTGSKIVSLSGGTLYPVRFNNSSQVFPDVLTSYDVSVGSESLVGCVAAGEVRINYSATLKDVVGVNSRANNSFNNLVKPTDTIELIADNTAYSNLADTNRLSAYGANNPYPIITAARNTNQDIWKLEFAALINNYGVGLIPGYTGAGTYDNPGESYGSNYFSPYLDYVSNEIYFAIGKKQALGLAINNLTVEVVGRDLSGNIVFTGTLCNACNLTHCRNNRPEIINMFNDPSKYLNFNLENFSKTARPIMPQASANFGSSLATVFTCGNSQNGTQPIKTLAICDSDISSANANDSVKTVIEVTAEPIE